MEDVSQWGGRHGSEVSIVDAGWVELAVVGDSGKVVVCVGDTGGTVGFIVVISGTSGGLGVVL